MVVIGKVLGEVVLLEECFVLGEFGELVGFGQLVGFGGGLHGEDEGGMVWFELLFV